MVTHKVPLLLESQIGAHLRASSFSNLEWSSRICNWFSVLLFFSLSFLLPLLFSLRLFLLPPPPLGTNVWDTLPPWGGSRTDKQASAVALPHLLYPMVNLQNVWAGPWSTHYSDHLGFTKTTPKPIGSRTLTVLTRYWVIGTLAMLLVGT